MQLNLTDYEAQLLEQRLRGRTVSFSDADLLMLVGIADRLLAREVGKIPFALPEWTPVYEVPLENQTTIDYHGCGEWVARPTTIKAPEGRRFHLMNMPKPHTVRRETDEYACSCGARWSYDDVDGHP